MQGPKNPRGVATALGLEALLLGVSLVKGFGDSTVRGTPVWLAFTFGTLVATAGVVQSWLYPAGHVRPVLTSLRTARAPEVEPSTEEAVAPRRVEVLVDGGWLPALLDSWKTVHLGLYGRVQLGAGGPEWVEADRVRSADPESLDPKPD
jgi:hypothetical protein